MKKIILYLSFILPLLAFSGCSDNDALDVPDAPEIIGDDWERIEQTAWWEEYTNIEITMPSSYGYMFLPLYMGTPEVLHNNVLEIQDQDQLATQGVSGTKEEFTYFAKAKVDCTVEITANFSFKPSVSSNTSIYFYRLTNDKRLSEITKWTSNDNVNFRDIVDQKVSVNLLAEEHLCFFVIGVAKSIITFDKTNISLNWMDAIPPQK